jgi:hypothetical protein
VQISLHGRTAYVAVPGPGPQPDTFYASPDGGHWSARPSPCSKQLDQSLAGVAAISPVRVALLCIGNPGRSMADKPVFRSDDTALTTTSAGSAPADGISSALAATPGGTLAVDSASDGNWIYLNTGGQTWSTVVANGNNGWNDLTFATNTTGFVVESPAATSPTATSALLATHDSGRHWSAVPIG